MLILHNEEGSAAQERHEIHSSDREIMYALTVISIENLIECATVLLQADIDSGELDTMPKIPCNDTVRL